MEQFALIIFGITSNLSQIKLIPALYDMAEKGLLPEKMTILGTARKPQSDDEFKSYVYNTLVNQTKRYPKGINKEVYNQLVSRFHYIDGHLDDQDFYPKLKQFMEDLSQKGQNCENKIFYLATYPELYHFVFENLQKVNLNKQECGWTRLMIEKPLGKDLDSSKKLNDLLSKYFSEDQIFRLDHYLGKETIQNILTFRFGNGLLEPLINKDFIDSIQITSAENFGIAQRGGYYDTMGALKDVGQNHLLQMLTFVTMDAPIEFSNEEVTLERIKILQNLVPLPDEIVFGQYEGYKDEANVSLNSNTDTFFALKTFINNDRFRNVPIYIRAGKYLPETVTEISIVFKPSENRLFKHLESGTEPNVLTFRIQPNEGIVLKILTKKPGHDLKLETEYMQFCYKMRQGTSNIPDPYERLLIDTIRGNQTFFNNAEEVEAEWRFIDPLSENKSQIFEYSQGTWGPKEADELIEKDGRYWITPSMQFCMI